MIHFFRKNPSWQQYAFICILLPLLHICLPSCCKTNKYENLNNSFEANYNLGLCQTSEFAIHLDSVTQPYFTAMQYDETSGFLILENENRLYKLDEDTDSLFLFKKLENYATSFSFNQPNNFISLIDYAESRYISYYGDSILDDIPFRSNIYYPSPIVKIAPLIANDDYLWIIGNFSGEYIDENATNRPAVVRIDKKTNEIIPLIPYPQFYYEYDWGGGLMWWVYADFLSKRNSLLISFPASHYIEEWSLDGKLIKKYFAGSKFITSINSFSWDKTDHKLDEETKYFVEQDSYANIFYDCYRDVYYRFAEKGQTYKRKYGWHKTVSVIIFNSSMDIIGETKLPDGLANYRYGTFVNEAGLNIPYTKNEDVIFYKVFTLCENN